MVTFSAPSGGALGIVEQVFADVLQALHRSLAVRRGVADDQPAVIILNGPGEDLAGAGAELAGEHDQRSAPQHAPLGVVVVLDAFVGIFDLHDRPVVDEQSGQVDRFGQRTAAVAAQIEHDGVDFLLVEFFEQSGDVARGAFVVFGRPARKPSMSM